MIKSLQAGRAIAATAVFAGHLEMLMSKPKYGGSFLFDHWTLLGGLGVDFFFILSGFIICFAHGRDIGRPERAASYAWRRFARVYPNYWIVTIGFMALTAAGVGTADFSTAPLDVLSSFALIHFTPGGAPLGVAWTLFYEIFFYLLFVTLILNRRAGLAVMAIWLLLILSHFADPFGGKRTFVGDALSWMNLNFFIGMVLYWLYQRDERRMAWPVAAIGLALLILAGWIGRNGGFVSVPWTRLIASVALAALLYAAIALERAGRLAVPQWLKFLGDASYSIYLTHVSLSSFFLIVITKLHVLRHVSPYPVYAVGIVVVLALASLFHLLVERPLIGLLRRKPPAGAGMAAPSVAG